MYRYFSNPSLPTHTHILTSDFTTTSLDIVCIFTVITCSDVMVIFRTILTSILGESHEQALHGKSRVCVTFWPTIHNMASHSRHLASLSHSAVRWT